MLYYIHYISLILFESYSYPPGIVINTITCNKELFRLYDFRLTPIPFGRKREMWIVIYDVGLTQMSMACMQISMECAFFCTHIPRYLDTYLDTYLDSYQ